MLKAERFIGPYLYVGYHCNNDCIFCSEHDDYLRMNEYKPISLLKNEILLIRKKYDFINIMGREPTLRKDILEILDFARNLDFKQVGITSNGRLFSYPQFTKRVLDKGVNQIAVSISGAKSQTHDKQTKVKGSFEQTISGIKNIIQMSSDDISLLVNFTLNKLNMNELKEALTLLNSIGVKEINILNIAPLSSRSNNKSLIAKMSQAGKHLKDVLKNAKAEYPETKILLVEFLPCALPPELREYFSPCLEKNPRKVRIPICDGCPYFDSCDGVLEDYIHLYGVDEFKSLK